MVAPDAAKIEDVGDEAECQGPSENAEDASPAAEEVHPADGHCADARGVDVNRITVLTYVWSGVFAACAGLVLLSRLGIGDPNAGTPFLSVGSALGRSTSH